jgi:type IV pilus assembly protein PilA
MHQSHDGAYAGALMLRRPKVSRLDAGVRGFTLIELMVVVAIIGVLAAIAIPKFLDYMKRGKQVEAVVHLGAIAKSAETEFVENASFPQIVSDLTPDTPCCDQPRRRCAVDATQWNDVPAWDTLGFEMTQPFLFQYRYTSVAAAEYEAQAIGDLDCDGSPVTYRMLGDATTGSPSSHMIRPARAD